MWQWQGMLFKNQDKLIDGLSKKFATTINITSIIEEKVNNPESFEKIAPVIEEHVDDFLRNKIAAEMPMISMLIGEKTITQLKGIFIKELKHLFPVIISNYAQKLTTDFNAAAFIKQHINLYQIINENLLPLIKKQLLKIYIISFLIGGLLGLAGWFIFV
mgnify:CR=1 FL=1